MADQEIEAAPSYAQEIVALVESDGVGALARSLGCSRRQAEQAERAARRALALGMDVAPGQIPSNTVAAAMAVCVPAVNLPTVPARPPPGTVEQRMAAEARASRIAILRENVRHGYTEWADELARLEAEAVAS